MPTPKDILIGWVTSKWLQPNWTAAQFAEGILSDLDAAGYVIVPKEPTARMMFGTKTDFPETSLGMVWREMIEAYRVHGDD